MEKVVPEGKMFTLQIFYFKPSGKFYSEATANWLLPTCGGMGTAYMQTAVDRIRDLRGGKLPGNLPGLSSQSWSGPILINCEEGYPCLILPLKSTEDEKEPEQAVSTPIPTFSFQEAYDLQSARVKLARENLENIILDSSVVNDLCRDIKDAEEAHQDQIAILFRLKNAWSEAKRLKEKK